MTTDAHPCPRCGRTLPPSDALDTRATLLVGMLEITLLGEIDRQQQLPWPDVEALARHAVDVVASQGDILQFRGSKPGQSAAAFAATARGVAALSFAPGGVTFCGSHWCAEHPSVASVDGQYRWKHTWLKHTDCTNPLCGICEGGLLQCVRCGGAEASLPTDCPGRTITTDEEWRVRARKIDFVAGAWITR